MPALKPYMPDAQADFNNWLVNFSTLISAEPYRYSLLPSDAADIAATVAEWTAAYLPVTSNAKNTTQAVAAKDTARVMAEALIRPYAQRIANLPGVSVGSKVALGLNPRTSSPSPITPPNECPVLLLQSGSILTVVLRYRNSVNDVSVKAKPYGVTACQIFAKTSPTRITDQDALPFKVMATKSPFQVHFSAAEGGQQAYFAARWAIRTGGVSPWSQIVSFTVPTG